MPNLQKPLTDRNHLYRYAILGNFSFLILRNNQMMNLLIHEIRLSWTSKSDKHIVCICLQVVLSFFK